VTFRVTRWIKGGSSYGTPSLWCRGRPHLGWEVRTALSEVAERVLREPGTPLSRGSRGLPWPGLACLRDERERRQLHMHKLTWVSSSGAIRVCTFFSTPTPRALRFVAARPSLGARPWSGAPWSRGSVCRDCHSAFRSWARSFLIGVRRGRVAPSGSLELEPHIDRCRWLTSSNRRVNRLPSSRPRRPGGKSTCPAAGCPRQPVPQTICPCRQVRQPNADKNPVPRRLVRSERRWIAFEGRPSVTHSQVSPPRFAVRRG
jgi:hypothetical protein